MITSTRTRPTTQLLNVFPHCPNTIREFGPWSYKRTARGELPPGDDQFEDRNNDAMDVVKGLVAAELAYDVAPIIVIGGDGRDEQFDLTGLEPVPPFPLQAAL